MKKTDINVAYPNCEFVIQPTTLNVTLFIQKISATRVLQSRTHVESMDHGHEDEKIARTLWDYLDRLAVNGSISGHKIFKFWLFKEDS